MLIRTASNQSKVRDLSDEVNQIASKLAHLSAQIADSTPVTVDGSGGWEPSADFVRDIIRMRRMRAQFWPDDLFADPAWDMLLDLFRAELAQMRVSTSSLCLAAAVPATTALRWLGALVAQGMVTRRSDPHDGRRVFVELTPQASETMRNYLRKVGPNAVI